MEGPLWEEMMPDGSVDCIIIMNKLEDIQNTQQLIQTSQQTIREMHVAQVATVSTEIAQIKTKIDSMDEKIDEISRAAAKRDGMFDGAVFTMAKVGTFVTMGLAAIGWWTTGGGWVWVKEHILK
jgi:hypothetical protein